MGNHTVNNEITESAVNSNIIIPLIQAYDNEKGKLMGGNSSKARVGHNQEDSIIKVGAYIKEIGKDGKIKGRRPVNNTRNTGVEFTH